MEKFKTIIFFFNFLKFLCDAKLSFFRFRENIQKYILAFFFRGKIQKNIQFEEKFWENLGDAD